MLSDPLAEEYGRLSIPNWAWFKSWVFQVTVRTVPVPRRWRFFLGRTDSRFRNAGSGSSPACLTRAGGVGLSAAEREFFPLAQGDGSSPAAGDCEEELQSAQIISDPLAAEAKVAP